MPQYEEGEASFDVTSDHCENQNSTEYNRPQTFEEGEYGAWTASNFTNEPEVINSTNNKQIFFFLQVISYVRRIYQQLCVSFTGRYLSNPSTTGLIAWL